MKFKSLVSAAALLTAIGISSSAQAIIVQAEPNDFQGELVLFSNNTQTGLSVTGLTNQTQTGVVFTGTTVGNGQTIVGTGGQAEVRGAGDLLLTSVSFQLNNGLTFNNNEFTIFGGTATQVDVVAIDNEGQVFNFNDVTLPNSGMLAFRGIAGETIAKITISANAGFGFEALRQDRLEPTNIAAVPGPIAGAGLPALMALGGFVWARRRKAAATA